MEKIRLNKFVSTHFNVSRRTADRMIAEGRVTVNRRPGVQGMPVDENDEVSADGQRLLKRPVCHVLLFNKPKGVVCSEQDAHATAVVGEYINLPYRVFTIGRLDKDSSGLLMLTNDGGLSRAMTKASSRIEKEYVVRVNKPINDSFIEKLQAGVPLPDLGKTTLPCKIFILGKRSFRMVLTQGLNKQIRRMCKVFDYQVLDLKRIRIDEYFLGDIEPGKYVELNAGEIKALKKRVALLASRQ